MTWSRHNSHAADLGPTETPLFAGWPTGWFMFCSSQALRRGPVGKQAFGRKLVAFRTQRGEVGVMTARCAHLGADLSGGCVVEDTLQCPFHHWRYAANGRCVGSPAGDQGLASAQQVALPAVERMGGVYFYHGRQAGLELPFYSGLTPTHVSASRPFSLQLDCPWYMVGANGVDVQHFSTTHDRQLLAPPVIDYPRPDVHHSVTRFGVVGRHWRDRLTRLAGDEVRLEVCDYRGTLFLVRAVFRRTQTFGIVSLLPQSSQSTEVHVIVAVRKQATAWGRWLFDPVNAWLRRCLIRKFLQPDVARSAGTDCVGGQLVPADQYLMDYFDWLRALHGVPSESHRELDTAESRRPGAAESVVNVTRCAAEGSEP